MKRKAETMAGSATANSATANAAMGKSAAAKRAKPERPMVLGTMLERAASAIAQGQVDRQTMFPTFLRSMLHDAGARFSPSIVNVIVQYAIDDAEQKLVNLIGNVRSATENSAMTKCDCGDATLYSAPVLLLNLCEFTCHDCTDNPSYESPHDDDE